MAAVLIYWVSPGWGRGGALKAPSWQEGAFVADQSVSDGSQLQKAHLCIRRM